MNKKEVDLHRWTDSVFTSDSKFYIHRSGQFGDSTTVIEVTDDDDTILHTQANMMRAAPEWDVESIREAVGEFMWKEISLEEAQETHRTQCEQPRRE